MNKRLRIIVLVIGVIVFSMAAALVISGAGSGPVALAKTAEFG